MKKKVLLIILCIVFIVAGIGVVLNLDKIILFAGQVAVMNSEIDTSEWVLENQEFKVVPEITDNVKFKVYDKSNKLVFDYEGEWRRWDFKRITLCDNNDIVIETGDMGTETFVYSNGTWGIQ